MTKLLISMGAALVLSPASFAASLQSAEVTKVINEVKIFRPSASAKKARVGDTISGKTSVQTGRRSRSELRFQDDTLTRVGANSIFSFEQGTRDLSLEQGTILLTVPKNAGGARIRTATVTAAVTGTTILMEYFRDKWVKIIVLEGTLETWLEIPGKKKKKKKVKSGQMLVFPANGKVLPNPVNIDLNRLMATGGLTDVKIFGPLPAGAQALIAQAVAKQDNLKNEGVLVPQAGGGIDSGPGERASDSRQIVNEGVVIPPPPREGDDPAN